jgi:hypothetical protein
MQIDHTQIDHHLYEIQLYDFLNLSHEILSLLEQHQDWCFRTNTSVVPDNPCPGQIGNFEHAHAHPLLMQYLAQFIDKTREQLFDILLGNKIFVSMHKEKTKEWMITNVILTCNFYVVLANYGIDYDMHVDGPLDKTIALGLIYFVHENDPGRSTIFRDWSDRHNIVISTGYRRGWLVVNSDRSLHQTCNTSKHNRYGMKFQINIK